MNTLSEQVINAASNRFGTIDYSRWQSVRGEFYSWVTYPQAGASTISFFGNVVGQAGITLADTNMPKAGSFGQVYFLCKTVSMGIKIWNDDVGGFTLANQATLDRRAAASDWLAGFVQAGFLRWNIGARPFLELPKPFQYAPNPGTDPDLIGVNGPQLSASTAVSAGFAVNPSSSATAANRSASVLGIPRVTQIRDRKNVFRLDPQILVEPEQQFDVTLSYPSGVIPVIAQEVTNLAGPGGVSAGTNTNPFKVGVILSGVILRPVQ
jgi:hypothetical protein